MTGRMDDLSFQPAPGQLVAFLQQVVDAGYGRRRHAEESRLHVHRLIQWQIVPVHQHRSAGVRVQARKSAHMVNVRVRAYDGLYGQLVPAEQVENARNLVAGIDHQSFACDRIPDDRAIALQLADGNGDLYHAVAYGIKCADRLRHGKSIALPRMPLLRKHERTASARRSIGARMAKVSRHDMDVAQQILETPLAASHRAAGATMSAWFGCWLPESFGNPQDEQRFANQSVALIDNNYRAYLAFTGPDRVRYLHAIVTNNVKDLREGEGTLTLLLNPQGHILAELEVRREAERLFGITYAMVRDAATAWLDKYIIMDDVTLADETQRYHWRGRTALRRTHRRIERGAALFPARAGRNKDNGQRHPLRSREAVAGCRCFRGGLLG